MRFLLDTNILIAAEPTRMVEAGTASAIELIGLAYQHGHSLHSHPATHRDLERNPDASARELSGLLFRKYPPLQYPPTIQPAITSLLGAKEEGSNEWVDHCMLAAVLGNAVDFLVTDDAKLRARASRLNLEDRTMHPRGAISLIRRYAPAPSAPLPLVQQVQAHALDAADQIFVSVRSDYAPGFDDWFERCQIAHRDTWIIGNETNDALAAVTIVNQETDSQYIFGGKTLKICLFKVSEFHSSMRYGELLLKAVLDYAVRNQYESAFLTVFEKHEEVVAFAKRFGFVQTEVRTSLGELVLKKSFNPSSDAASLSSWDYHIAYGPRHYRHVEQPAFVVPIQPRFHDLLFPESSPQLLPERNPFGTGIQKAYLCNAGLRAIRPGSVLYFYRSNDLHAITAVGIAEKTIKSSDPSEIARYVGRRTVYSIPEITDMASKGKVLAILFRQARILESPIPDRSLQQSRVWKRPPQSIMRLGQRAVEWIEGRA